MKERKQLKFIDLQIKALEMRIASEQYGSEEYAADLNNLHGLLDLKEQYKRIGEIDWPKLLTAIAAIAAIGTQVSGQMLTFETAKLAYADDAQMKMINGHVWRIKDDYSKYYKK